MDDLKNKTILVTGANGLVGTNTLLKLKNVAGLKIRAVYHSEKPNIESENIEYEQADLTNAEDCQRVVNGVDYVLMFAAHIARRSKNLDHVINTVEMNLKMLEAAYHEGVQKYVWLSSATAYPFSQVASKEEQMFEGNPHDDHFALGWSMRYIEKMCEAYAAKMKSSMDVTILRPTAIYGPHGDFEFATCHVLPALIRRVIEREDPLEVWGTGETKRDFVYVDDVIDACFLALDKVKGFDVFNVGSGQATSVKDLLNLIIECDQFFDANVVFDPAREVRSPVILVDESKAKNVLNFEAKTSLKEGINQTIQWYKCHSRESGKLFSGSSLSRG